MFSREDTVRLGPKRPPVAGWVRADETGVLAVAAPETLDDRSTLRASIASVAPDLEVEFVEVVGPPTAATARAAGWAEAAVLVASCRPPEAPVVAPNGAAATATVRNEGGREVVSVSVKCGTPLDDAVLRSYCTGAAHMALGWVRSESLAVDERGVPLDLTIRSFGVLRAVDMPRVEVTIEPEDATPVNGSDAVFAAVAAAAWRAAGFSPTWPAGVAGG
jgi:CO/xanthine dehydrogenase Mo-binding subunit